MSEVQPFNIQRALKRIRRVIVFSITICSMLFLALLIFVPVDERLSAQGRIRAETDTYIFSPVDGLLEKIDANIGDSVKAGDPVISLDTTELKEESERLNAKIELARSELQFEKAQMSATEKLPLPKEFWHVQEELDSSKEKLRQAQVEVARSEELNQKGLVSLQELERIKLNLEVARNEEKKVEEKLHVLNEGFEDALLKQATTRYQAKASELDSLMTEKRLLIEKIERYTLRAPNDGVVTLQLKIRPGEKVEKGEKLAHISHGLPTRVDLFVGESKMHRVRVGQYVRIKPSTYDTLRYGYAEGVVEEVPQEPEELSFADGVPTHSTYRVKARITKTPQPLVIGSTVSARITLRRVPLWRLLLPDAASSDTK